MGKHVSKFMALTTIGAMLLLMIWGADNGNPGLGVLCLWPIAVLSVTIHEMGHYVAARVAGMTVLMGNVMGVEFQVARRGWRLRVASLRGRGLSGYVLAIPAWGQPMRKAFLAMMAGGPVANLIVACGFLIAALCGAHASTTCLLLATAVHNAGMGVGSLLPRPASSGHTSDGQKLLTWWRRPDESAPGFAHIRLLARSLAGQMAQSLPDDDVSVLEQQPDPMPLVALWYRMKADQNRGLWTTAAAHGTKLDALEQALTPAMMSAIKELRVTMRMELAFSRAVETRDPTILAEPLRIRRAYGSSPWLLPRCRALDASLRGDARECARQLAIAARRADNALDRSTPSSEAALRGYIQAMTQDASTATTTDLSPAA